MQLIKNDIRHVVQRVPKDIREALTRNAGKLYIGGGFIRAVIAGEEPSDIDMFSDDVGRLEVIANDLANSRPGSRLHKTKNAITLLTPDRMPVQFITRWTFDNPKDLVNSFDFTVCQAALWRTGIQVNSEWATSINDRFYIDLAGRNLVYTNPVREEEAGGSMLRVLKYVKRGYSIQVGSLADVMDRVFKKVQIEIPKMPGYSTGGIISDLLREVDPLMIIEGLDIIDDHEPAEAL